MFNRLVANVQITVMELTQDRRGVTAVEYAIIAVAMSALVLAVYTNGDVKAALTDAMGTIKSNITSAKTVSK